MVTRAKKSQKAKGAAKRVAKKVPGKKASASKKGAARKKAGTKKGAARKKARAPKKATAKRRVARAGARPRDVYKVSPNRGRPIDDWIEAYTSGWQADLVRTMIEIVRAAAPEAAVSIKWSQPVFEQNGPFAFIKPAKAHVSFGFWRGAEVFDPKGILERGDRMGHFKLTAPEQLDAGALAVMVQDAVRLNQEKGSPAKRG